MLLNINPLKKMFEEIFFLFMKSEMKKIRKGSTEPSVSPTFAVNRRLNKNEEKHQ